MKNKIFVGDNLKVLNDEMLSPYINNVGMIYIDPPYNNGSRFSYKNSGFPETWVNYIKPRIASSYKYMKEDSAIFVSIDDSEYAPLKIMMNEIFGEENFVGTFITRQAQRSNAKHINIVHEYVLCYAKNKKKLAKFQIKRMDIPEDREMIKKIYREVKRVFKNQGKQEAQLVLNALIEKNCKAYGISWLRNYCNIDDSCRIYFAKDLSTPGDPRSVDIPEINLHLDPLKTRGWPQDKKILDLYKDERLVFRNNRPYVKHYLEESEDNAPSILNFYSRQGSEALKKLGINKIFDTPKPVELIKFLMRLYCKEDTYIMDYFAGSGTTAQAVYEVNREDKKNHNYILIQLNEKVDKNTDSYEECIKIGIKPEIQYILKYRIDTYLKKNKKECDYDFYDYEK